MNIRSLYKKMEDIESAQRDQVTQLAIYNQQLAEHMRRTEALEKRFDSYTDKIVKWASLIGGVLALAKLAHDYLISV